MTTRTLATIGLAALLVLAGCLGGPAGDSGSGENADAVAATTPVGGNAGDTGLVHFYVSDDPNAIDDFEHLNVTISAVGLHRVDGGTPAPDNDTATPTATSENDTSTATATGETADDDGPDDGDAEDGHDEREGDDEDDGEGDAGWVEYEVNATVDLTELVGANATQLDVLEAPAGSYDKVFVYVDEIDAVLENGEAVNVKLPSERLHINKQFEVGNGEAVEFVFDIAVHRAGNSGKYILRPVVSQSGTGDEVEIDETDDGDGEDDREGDGESDGSLDVEFQGPVEPGREATVKVTGRHGPVEGATVEVDGEVVGETGADGTVSFDVPAEADAIEVTVRYDGAEAELRREFEDGEQGNGAVVAVSSR